MLECLMYMFGWERKITPLPLPMDFPVGHWTYGP